MTLLYYYRKAFYQMQRRRFCISPNIGFIRQLREYEPICRAHKYIKNGSLAHIISRNKRSLPSGDDDTMES